MLASGEFTKQKILAYFSRPSRSINQARIIEIEDNHERYQNIVKATDNEYKQFVDEWEQVAFPSAPKVDLGPVHPQTLKALFPAKSSQNHTDPTKIAVTETDIVEGKESFNWGSKDVYAKTIVGFANNRGGYLLFGVKDLSFEVVGIAENRMERFDLKKANQYLSRTFTQAIRIEAGTFVVHGKTIGAFYIHPASSKPVICKVDGSGLFSGDVYYRYPGESRCIQAPELEIILRDRDREAGQRLMNVAQKVQDIGVEDAAIMNLNTGSVDGDKGHFMMSEDLLSTFKIIKEGRLSDVDGAPTLKLIGDLQVVSGKSVIVDRKVKDTISERDIIIDFLNQENVSNPKAYIAQLCHIQPVYLPIYFFASLANLSQQGLIEFLRNVETPYANRVEKQVSRVSKGKCATTLPSRQDLEKYVLALCGNEAIAVEDDVEAKKYLKAIRLLKPEDVELERVLSVLIDLHARFGNAKNLRSDFRYAISDIDLMWFRAKHKS